jgi:hypothetical protein
MSSIGTPNRHPVDASRPRTYCCRDAQADCPQAQSLGRTDGCYVGCDAVGRVRAAPKGLFSPHRATFR